MRPPQTRYHRNTVCDVGPSLVLKKIVAEDSAEIFPIHGGNQQWIRTGHRTDAVLREDPLGLADFAVPYSLDKKKRWTISERVETEIEGLQDPSVHLRVSAAMLQSDRSRTHWRWSSQLSVPSMTAAAYHDVGPDNEVIHRTSNSPYRTRLQTLTTKTRPKKKRGERPMREMDEWEFLGLPVERDETFQKVHVRYSVYDLCKPRPSMNDANTRSHDRYRYRYNMDKERRIEEAENLELHLEQLGGICPCMIHDYEEMWAEPAVVDDDEEDFVPEAPVSSADICDFVVVRTPKARRKKRSSDAEATRELPSRMQRSDLSSAAEDRSLRCFPRRKSKSFPGDDPMLPKAAVQFVTVLDSDEDDDDLSIISVPSSSRANLRPPQESFLFPINSAVLAGAERLEVSPATWVVHNVVAGLDMCGVAKVIGGEIHFFDGGHCSKCRVETIRWKVPTLPSISADSFESLEAPIGEVCGVCNERMEDLTDLLPFALACGHFFCTACWLRHAEQCIRIENLPVPCMEPRCPGVLSIGAARSILDGPSHGLYKAAVEDAVVKAQKAVRCPRCTLVLDVGEAGARRSIVCACGQRVCLTCSRPFHAPLPCNVYGQYVAFLKKNELDNIYRVSKEAIHHSVGDLVSCPHCHEYIERAKGCNHMVCSCGASMCFVCGKPWSGAHYNCDKINHKTIALVDVMGTGSFNLIPSSLLVDAMAWRRTFMDGRKALERRLGILPISERIAAMDAVWKLWQLCENALLNKRRKRSSVNIRNHTLFVLGHFLNTNDGKFPHFVAKINRLVAKHAAIEAAL